MSVEIRIIENSAKQKLLMAAEVGKGFAGRAARKLHAIGAMRTLIETFNNDDILELKVDRMTWDIAAQNSTSPFRWLFQLMSAGYVTFPYVPQYEMPLCAPAVAPPPVIPNQRARDNVDRAVNTLLDVRKTVRVVGPNPFSPEIERVVSTTAYRQFRDRLDAEGIEEMSTSAMGMVLHIPVLGAFERRQQIKEILDSVCAIHEEPEDDERTLVIVAPKARMRRIFDVTDDQAKVVCQSPWQCGSQVQGKVYTVNAKSDDEYHEMVRWVDDYRGRAKV